MKKAPCILITLLALFCVGHGFAFSGCHAVFKSYGLHLDKTSAGHSSSQDIPVAELTETEDEKDESASHKLLAVLPYTCQVYICTCTGQAHPGKYTRFPEPVSRFLSIRSLRI